MIELKLPFYRDWWLFVTSLLFLDLPFIFVIVVVFSWIAIKAVAIAVVSFVVFICCSVFMPIFISTLELPVFN